MKGFKTFLGASAIAAVVAAGAVIGSTGTASARVVCNRYGDCWHVSQRYRDYPDELRIRFHNDNWERRHMHGNRYHWRDTPGHDRGYYDRGNWRDFDHDRDHDHDGRRG